jgi:phosphate transport system substrate-binding protein
MKKGEKMKKNLSLIVVTLLLVSLHLVSCSGGKNATVKEATDLTGAGATFPKVLYEKYFENYNQIKHVQINYQAVGSGAGISNLIEKMVDFGATDAPMNEEEEKNAGAIVLHIPAALGAVVISYNLPEIPMLRLDASVISGIFLGSISNWSDPAIKTLNPDLPLPNQDIIVVHRSDGSGTTYTFTDYLTKADKTWADKLGKGKSVNWPVGLGGKGNDGVAGLMKQNIGSIGYIEYIFAENNGLSSALIKNKSGNFVAPSLESVSLASNVDLPDDLKVSITDTEAKDGYPISTFTWLLVYQEQKYANRKEGKGLAIANMVWWVIHEAQEMNEQMDFGKLAPNVVQKAEILVKSITYDGIPLIK